MIFANKLEKKLTNKYKNISTTQANTIKTEFNNNAAYRLDLMTYKRIYSLKMKREFYKYIITKFYYPSVRKELCPLKVIFLS